VSSEPLDAKPDRGHIDDVDIPVFEPMLATLDAPWPRGAVIEPKWDGVRSIVTVRADGAVTIRSRHGKDVTSSYPELHAVPRELAGRAAVFDGEVIAVDDAGRCSFQRLQRRMNVARPSRALRSATTVYFVVFDLLWLDGHSLVSAPLSERRAELGALFVSPSGAWQITNRLSGPVTDELLDRARAAGLEGLILKRDGPYRPGTRSKDWVKVKFRRTHFAVVGGRATDSRSLAIGVYADGALRYVGQVGLAMPRSQADQLDAFLERIRQPDSPFADLASGAPVTFVDPHVVVEVSYVEVTAAGTLRQPVLEAVRPDVAAATVEADAEMAAVLSTRTAPVPMRSNQRL
jgi:bifunctional non-homologous end joining protein LigD